MNFSRINLTVLVAVLAGCSSQPVLSGNDPTEVRLRAVGQAYGRAADALKRPPRNADELRKFLPEVPDTEPTNILTSARDNQPFVVVGGIDFRLADATPESPTVLAYERTVTGGERWAIDYRMTVRRFSEAEFTKVPFPPNHRHP